MKIPEWLPDTHRPMGPEYEPGPAEIERWAWPIADFMHVEAAGGLF
ncbi:MAG: hypothetical protein WD738_19360 [Pirellulales bacterium]